MSKPEKSMRLIYLETCERIGFLTPDKNQELESLRLDHEAAQYDEADKVNDVKYEKRAENE